MIKIINRIFIISALALVIASCSTSEPNTLQDKEIENLTVENDSLRKELNRLQHLPEYCQVIAYPTFENLNVKIGDTNTLYIGLLRAIDKKPPVVVLWNEETNSYSDTIVDVNGLGISSTHVLAKKKGANKIKGEVIYFCNERETLSLFESTFFVE